MFESVKGRFACAFDCLTLVRLESRNSDRSNRGLCSKSSAFPSCRFSGGGSSDDAAAAAAAAAQKSRSRASALHRQKKKPHSRNDVNGDKPLAVALAVAEAIAAHHALHQIIYMEPWSQ